MELLISNSPFLYLFTDRPGPRATKALLTPLKTAGRSWVFRLTAKTKDKGALLSNCTFTQDHRGLPEHRGAEQLEIDKLNRRRHLTKLSRFRFRNVDKAREGDVYSLVYHHIILVHKEDLFMQNPLEDNFTGDDMATEILNSRANLVNLFVPE